LFVFVVVFFVCLVVWLGGGGGGGVLNFASAFLVQLMVHQIR
jgi:hypothetical protein